MTRRMIAFALAWFCVLPCAGRADEPRLRVFYTGHSFHMFVPSRVGLTAKAAGVKEYQHAGKQGIGGSRVIQHWDKDKGDNVARKALEKGDVDVFTMAPHLKIPDEGIDHFVELGLKHNPKMRFLVQQSWVPFDYLDKRVKDNAERDAPSSTWTSSARIMRNGAATWRPRSRRSTRKPAATPSSSCRPATPS